jgi:hypothetical protein
MSPGCSLFPRTVARHDASSTTMHSIRAGHRMVASSFTPVPRSVPQFPDYAVTPHGKAHSLPEISLSRGARRLVVRLDAKLVALRGEVGRGDRVDIDLVSGAERTLVRFADDFVVRDLEVAPDGREVIFDRLVDR